VLNEESLKSVEELHRLKAAGVITEDEFNRAKERILFGQQKTPNRDRPAQNRRALACPSPDDLIGWITLPLRRYAEFEGRSSRREFWMFQLLPFGILFAMMIAAIVDDQPYVGLGSFAILTIISGVLALVGLIIPQLAVQVRRFHDQNLSGWFALLNLIPYVGALIVFVFMLIPGTPGTNQFGSDPQEEMAS
jgi:uncharacterized membrane protein YhaH (DUF805 family)